MVVEVQGPFQLCHLTLDNKGRSNAVVTAVQTASKIAMGKARQESTLQCQGTSHWAKSPTPAHMGNKSNPKHSSKNI